MSGLREAARALTLLRGPEDTAADLVASRTQTLSKSDKRKYLEGVLCVTCDVENRAMWLSVAVVSLCCLALRKLCRCVTCCCCRVPLPRSPLPPCRGW